MSGHGQGKHTAKLLGSSGKNEAGEKNCGKCSDDDDHWGTEDAKQCIAYWVEVCAEDFGRSYALKDVRCDRGDVLGGRLYEVSSEPASLKQGEGDNMALCEEFSWIVPREVRIMSISDKGSTFPDSDGGIVGAGEQSSMA